MKDSWTSDPQKILEELITLVELEIPLTVFYRKNTAPVETTLQHVCGVDGHDYLVVKRPESWGDSKKNYVIYKKKGEPSKGFVLNIQKKSDNQLAALMPDEIFQINQRRHTRIDAPQDSKATVKFQDKQNENICQVKNLSLNGASLYGCPVTGIDKDDEIGPLTLSLPRSSYKSEIFDIVIPAARVVRVGEEEGEETVLGLSFRLDGETQEQLHKYLDLRIWEELEFDE